MKETDIELFAAVVGSFAMLVTAHLAIVAGLAARARRWRSPVAFFIAPLAPYWAVRERMFLRAVAWLLGALAYVGARMLAT